MQNVYQVYAMIVAILPVIFIIPLFIGLFLIVKYLKEINQSLKVIAKRESNK